MRDLGKKYIISDVLRVHGEALFAMPVFCRFKFGKRLSFFVITRSSDVGWFQSGMHVKAVSVTGDFNFGRGALFVHCGRQDTVVSVRGCRPVGNQTHQRYVWIRFGYIVLCCVVYGSLTL